ncbi:MAG: hypothetical protein JWO30_495 [Fibrobacteres bacterium]|nr:hypothetical protein [Fibrobacterota bacterium]
MNISPAFALAAFLGLISAPAAGAGCGLHSVPILSGNAPEAVELGGSFRRTAVEYGGGPGVYSEIGVTARFSTGGRWAFGLQWPLAILSLRDSMYAGMGNPTVDAEIHFLPGPGTRLGLGAQVELPLGDLADGLASRHFMGTAYASATKSWEGVILNGTAGMSMMSPWMNRDGEGMDHAAMQGASASGSSLAGRSLGNPHDNLEMIYRIAFRKNLGPGPAAVAAALDGQHVLGASMRTAGDMAGPGDTGRDFAAVEIGLPLAWGARTLSPYVQVPVSSARRIEWSLGMRGAVAL